MQQRFTPTTLFIAGGLLIWLGDFVFVYVFAAVACAKGFAHMQLVGLPLVPLVVSAANLLAAAAIAALLWISLRRRRTKPGDGADDGHGRFIDFLVLATGAIALLALLLLAVPGVLIEGCYRH